MEASTTPIARPVDHLVLPTAGLDVARERLTQLGFTVAPDGIHPFGTSNCCVYLADGTYLEPLAVTDQAAANYAVAAGNVFVARDRAYRAAIGDDGFSAVAFSTGKAEADHEWFLGKGVSAGDVLAFTRPFIDAAGRSDTASFRLAFAAAAASDDAFVFTCERVDAPKVDRGALQLHANGVTRLSAIVARSDRPMVARDLLVAAAWGDAAAGAVRAPIATPPQVALSILGAEALHEQFGVEPGRSTDLAFVAVVFAVADAAALIRRLDAASVPWERRAERIVVAPAPGQGAAYAFEVQK